MNKKILKSFIRVLSFKDFEDGVGQIEVKFEVKFEVRLIQGEGEVGMKKG